MTEIKRNKQEYAETRRNDSGIKQNDTGMRRNNRNEVERGGMTTE